MSRIPHSCNTCAHDGCCDHYCGGLYWRADEDEDAQPRDPREDQNDTTRAKHKKRGTKKGEPTMKAYIESICACHTHHEERVAEHYAHAREKHPHFCDRLLPAWTDKQIKGRIAEELALARQRGKTGVHNRDAMWNEVLNCEAWEATEAMANGDKAHAVEELYDAIAVLLRTIDVLEGRQPLGKPKEGTAS